MTLAWEAGRHRKFGLRYQWSALCKWVSSYTLDGVRARAVADRDADMDALKVENRQLRKQLMALDTSRAQTLMNLQRCKDETRRAYRDLGRLPQYQTQYVPQQRMPRPRDSRGRFVSQQTQPLVGAR